MRSISFIIIHCSAVMPWQRSSAADIDRWHKARGWSRIGYHYVVRRDGAIERGRPEDHVGAHCKGHNAHSIGVCYEGGLDADARPTDTRTPEQKATLLSLLRSLKKSYPTALIVGHSTLSRTHCPCFDAVKEYEDVTW